MDFRMPDGGDTAGWARTSSIPSLTQHINKSKDKRCFSGISRLIHKAGRTTVVKIDKQGPA
jgi:hypothetical protein